MILIGSRALALRIPIGRTPVDFDFVGYRWEFENWTRVNQDKIKVVNFKETPSKIILEGEPNIEWELIKSYDSAEMLATLVSEDSETMYTPFGFVPNLDLLFTIKASHRYLKNSPHFWKTVCDYHGMKALGAKVRPEYIEFLKLREAETYTYKHPKLDVSKDKFFAGDGVKYVHDHDDIHMSVAIGERPAYTYYLQDGAAVNCDKEKFYSLPHEVRINGVVEEAAVLAIERALVPFGETGMSPKKAWQFALSKVCTSITSGWFREFAYDNILEVLKKYPEGYWNKFKSDCDGGLIKPFTSSTY